MSWWRRRSSGTTSWSLVSLGACLLLLLVLGAWTWVPRHLSQDVVVDTPGPGLLSVAAPARAEVTLGDGFTASMSPSGLRVARDDWVIIDTVTRGSFVSAVQGSVTGTKEDVRSARTNVRVDSLALADGSATWRGVVYAGRGDAGLPLTVATRRTGESVQVSIEAPGADGLVISLDVRPATIGVAPQLPERNLRQRVWWVSGTGSTLFTNVLRARVGVTPGTAARAVDLRPDGYLALHAWSPRVTLDLDQVARADPAPTTETP